MCAWLKYTLFFFVWNSTERLCGKIYLCTDSQASMMTISDPYRFEVEDNERVIELANIGAKEYFLGPDPALGVPVCFLRYLIDIWCSRTKYNYWIYNPGYKYT